MVGHDVLPAVQAARIPRLRDFIFAHSKRRCQDQEQSTAMLESAKSFAPIIGIREVSPVQGSPRTNNRVEPSPIRGAPSSCATSLWYVYDLRTMVQVRRVRRGPGADHASTSSSLLKACWWIPAGEEVQLCYRF